MVTAELGSNPVPVTVTDVPTGPEVGLSVMAVRGDEFTVNVVESELTPSVAETIRAPVGEVGTVKSTENPPLLSVVTGLSGISVPPKVMVTSEFGSKLMPVISTEVPTGPESGLIEMTGSRGSRHCKCC